MKVKGKVSHPAVWNLEANFFLAHVSSIFRGKQSAGEGVKERRNTPHASCTGRVARARSSLRLGLIARYHNTYPLQKDTHT